MQKIKVENIFTKNTLVFLVVIASLLVLFISSTSAEATVESSVKGIGSSFQKIVLSSGVIGFSIGGLGLMFGAQWGMRTVLGSILGTCCVLGGNSMISFFSSQIN